MSRLVVAADFGGTNLRSALVNEAGDVVERIDRSTPAEASPDAILREILQLFRDIVARAPAPPVSAALGVPGLIDADQGMVILAPNVAGFRNLVLTAPIEEQLGIPVFIENDASAAALGEFRFGAGRGTRHLLHATLGTGIGGGIVIDGRLYRGARGLAGEIGHVIIDPAGPRCNCGSRGCLESMVSGVAFAERARRVLATGSSPLLQEIVGARDPSAADLQAAAEAGDKTCEAEIRHGGHLLGLGLGSLVNVLNPEAITLSGGLLNMGDMLLGPMKESMHSIAYGPASGTIVRISSLGDEAGLLGAAAVAFERVE
ncbi:MAG: ROK family protein [Dehalococcoidia bacterium]|nr:ROK family protein [Dehalococcoidia bacterium]